MEIAKEITHIVPVGFETPKLIASIRQYPIHKLIIVTLNGDEENQRVKRAVGELKDAFKGIKIEEKEIKREDVFKAVLDILDIVEEEVKEGRDVKINISGGMRNIGISAYIVALVSSINIYSDIPESGNDGVYVLKSILEIPPFPIKEVPKEQIDILHKLDSEADSLDVLISRLKPDLKKGTDKYNNERSRLSHHIKKLKADGFMETEKKGKNLVMRRSVLGEIYMRGKGVERLLQDF